MAVLPQALTTKADVKRFLDITVATDDTLLEQLIDNVTEWVEGMLGGRRIKETTYTDELHDGGEHDIFLPNFPITDTVTLVAEFRSGTIANPTFTAFTANDFIVYKNSGVVHFFARTPGRHLHDRFGFERSPKFEPGNQNLRFTFSAGFDTIPLDLELLAKQLVSLILDRRKAQNIKKETVEGTSIEYGGISSGASAVTLLTAEQKDVIRRYKRHNFGQNL